MVNFQAKLIDSLFDSQIKQKPTRDGFGEGLVLAGEYNERVVALCADLTDSVRMKMFKERFPERFIEVGIAEQNMAAVASGLAASGKIPFIASYATFSPGRNWEQIRTTICYNNQPVKIAGAHAGVSVGPDGATHQALEDIALMRVLPNMIVVVPCDSLEAQKATLAAIEISKPVYLRFGREKTPLFTTEETPFKIGRAEIFWESETSVAKEKTIAIIGCGPLLYYCLKAAFELEKEGRGVIVVNNHTIKPLDEKTILEVAAKVKGVVTVEEHQIIGGLGSAISELLSEKYPLPMKFIGMKDCFGESGEPNELLEKYQMTTKDIKKAVYQLFGS